MSKPVTAEASAQTARTSFCIRCQLNDQDQGIQRFACTRSSPVIPCASGECENYQHKWQEDANKLKKEKVNKADLGVPVLSIAGAVNQATDHLSLALVGLDKQKTKDDEEDIQFLVGQAFHELIDLLVDIGGEDELDEWFDKEKGDEDNGDDSDDESSKEN